MDIAHSMKNILTRQQKGLATEYESQQQIDEADRYQDWPSEPDTHQTDSLKI